MKKLLSILLAVILAFSAFTMVSFAEETTDAPADVTDAPTDINDSMYAKWIDKHFNSGIANTELAMEAIFPDVDAPINAYIKDGKMAIDASRKIGPLTAKFKLIVDANSESFKAYSPLLPLFYIELEDTGDFFEDFSDILFIDYSDFVLDSASKVQVSGTEYYVEEISGSIKAYFKDGELVHVETFEDDSFVGTLNISYDVSDKDVELPFYAFIDVTPLLTLFETLFGLI